MNPMLNRMSSKRRARLRESGTYNPVSTFARTALRRPQKPRDTGPSPRVRAAVLARDGYACVRCGMECRPGLNYSIHHRVDRSVGGTNAMSNLITLCGSGTTGCHGIVTEGLYFDGPNGDGYWLQSWCPPASHHVIYREAREHDDGSVHYEPAHRWYLHDDGSLSDTPERHDGT